MMKSLKISYLLIAINLFFSCENKEEITCKLPDTSISVTSTAFTGDNINLTTPDYSLIEPGIKYEWSGPNNFHSNERNTVITNVTPNMEGEYKLKITKGICSTEELTAFVDVIVNTVTCNQSDDTGDFTGLGSYNFYYNSAYPITDNQYQIVGGAYGMSVYVYFDGENIPSQGLYSIVNKSIALSPGTVHVKGVEEENFNQYNYYALSGDVLLTYNEFGHPTIKFCNVPFAFSSNTSADSYGSVKFTVTP